VCDGEENRVTEKYSWLPWLGMGIAGLVVLILFALMFKSGVKKDEMGGDKSGKGILPPTP